MSRRGKGTGRSSQRRSRRATPRTGRRGLFLWGGGLAFVTVVVVFSLFATGLIGRATSGTGEATSDASMAPELLLATADGRQVRLSELRGQPLLLYFSFPGWPTCGLEAPVLAKLREEYRPRGLEVVAINIQPIFSLDEFISFWKSKGAGDVLWAQDVGGRAIRDYRLLALGTQVILDRQGRIVFRSDGPASVRRLREEIEKLL